MGALKALAKVAQAAKAAKTAQDVLPAAEREANLAKFLENSKVKERLYRGAVGYGESGIPQEFLNGKPRAGYASFASTNPAIANTYAMPDHEDMESMVGAVTPLHVQAKQLIEFPNFSKYPNFDKFEFDRWAQRLKPGEVLVVRNVTDTGPRSTYKIDPEKLHTYGSDIYAWNEGTSVKSATGNRGTYDINDPDVNKAAGGDVHMAGGGGLKALGALANAIKRVNRVEEYLDKPAHNLQDWEWKPLSVPAAIVNATEVPEYIQKGYGDFMIKQAGRAAKGELTKRDLIKAYGITQSSIGRQGRKHSTATKAGLELPATGELVRPEGAFAEWLASPMGQRYLNEAEQGNTDLYAVKDIVEKFRPFGKYNELGKALVYGADVLGRDPRDINAMITGDKEAFRDYAKSIYGIDQSKAGFIGSLLGRGDLPTLDARQLALHTNPPTTVKVVGSILNRQKGKGGKEAVNRLIDRQEAMALDIDPSLDPFYQHLTHHTAWDRALDEITTHDDLIRAMQNYNEGGDVHMAGGGALKALGALGRAAKSLATSDAAYNLANKVAEATGAAPKQIMMGENSKTWNHGNAALAKHMELQGKNPEEIWQATRMFRGADDVWRQEIPDANMKYSASPVRSRQYETDRKRYGQAIDRATTQDELQAAQKYYEKQRKNNSLNFIGKSQEFIEHPELFAAYPELANYAFKELEPTHRQFTAPENTYGFYSPSQKSITVSADAPFKRSTALHELQHAIQEIEGWQGGSSPEEMAAKLAEREIAKTRENDLQQLIQEMQLTLPPSANNLILTEGQKLKNVQDFLKQTRRLEGEADPYKAYRRVSGEEEARMVQARRDYPEEKLAERPPFEDYESDPSYHITEFAAGGDVHAAGGGLIDLIRGAKDLAALAKRTDRIAESLVAGGMKEEKAFNQARNMAAQTILEEKFMPPEHPTAPPVSSKEIAEHAERVAKQVNGEYMNKEQAGRETTGKSQRQFKREKNLQADVRQNVAQPEPQVVDYGKHLGSMIVGVPGDATLGGLIRLPDGRVISTHELHGVGDRLLNTPIQLYGGPHYGLSHENSFWASNEGPAQGIQNLIQQLGEDYPVLGQYVKMGPGSEAFAMHNLEALMGVLRPEQLSRAKREALAEHVNAMRGKEWDKPKKDKPRSPDFVGFKDPEALLAQAEQQSDLRKVIAQLLSGPNEGRSKMAGFGLPSGSDVVTAITHPELRNIEQGASGFAIGKMNPNSGLTPGAHPTYEKDIPGEFIGRSAHPIPYDLAFPDTSAYLKYRQTYLPEDTGHFPLFKMQMGRQKITDQYVNQIDEYLRRMKQLTGRKKGGEVKKDE